MTKGHAMVICRNHLVAAIGSPAACCLLSLPWRHNERDGAWNHQPYNCLLNRLFRHRSKKTSKLGVTGLYEGKPPGTGGFPSQRASKVENVSIWWRHHGVYTYRSMLCCPCSQYGSPVDRACNSPVSIHPGTGAGGITYSCCFHDWSTCRARRPLGKQESRNLVREIKQLVHWKQRGWQLCRHLWQSMLSQWEHAELRKLRKHIWCHLRLYTPGKV